MPNRADESDEQFQHLGDLEFEVGIRTALALGRRAYAEACRARAAEEKVGLEAVGLRTEMEAWRSEANRLREELEGQRTENEAMAQRLKEHREDFRSQRARFDEKLQPLAEGKAAEQARAERAEAEVARLREESDRLRVALAPFARAWNEQEPDDQENDALEMHVRPSDCRKAAEVLDAQEVAPR